MKTYKEDQGRLARMAAFWGVVLLLLFGCTFLHTTLVTNFAVMSKLIGGVRIPVVGVNLTWAFLITFLVFVAGTIAIWKWQQKPRIADLLIETEGELKKVTWPTSQEVVNTSMVVIACVGILLGFVALADWVLGMVLKRLLLGGS